MPRALGNGLSLPCREVECPAVKVWGFAFAAPPLESRSVSGGKIPRIKFTNQPYVYGVCPAETGLRLISAAFSDGHFYHIILLPHFPSFFEYADVQVEPFFRDTKSIVPKPVVQKSLYNYPLLVRPAVRVVPLLELFGQS